MLKKTTPLPNSAKILPIFKSATKKVKLVQQCNKFGEMVNKYGFVKKEDANFVHYITQ
jgi:hypothetical protein